MKRITAPEFQAFIKKDPNWAGKLTEPIEIEGFAVMDGIEIENLSPLLTFLGNPNTPNNGVASFRFCKIQKVAGTFNGPVSFERAIIDHVSHETLVKETEDAAYFQNSSIRLLEGEFHGKITARDSHIQEIGKLIVINPKGVAADFSGCKTLKVAKGAYQGFVEFSLSTIEKIDGDPQTGLNLIPYDDEEEGMEGADFDDCIHLKIASGTFPGCVSFRRSGIETIDTHPITGLKVTGTNRKGMSADFSECPNLIHAAGEFAGQVNFIDCPKLKTGDPKTLKGPSPLCCLDRTPLLEKDPVLAGMLIFQIPTRNAVEIFKLANACWETRNKLAPKIEQVIKIRNALKKSGSIEI